jgi:hypothetical protein
VAYLSGVPEFTSGFSGVRVTRSLVLYVCFVDRCLSFKFVRFLLAIVLSVLLRYRDSDCPCVSELALSKSNSLVESGYHYHLIERGYKNAHVALSNNLSI